MREFGKIFWKERRELVNTLHSSGGYKLIYVPVILYAPIITMFDPTLPHKVISRTFYTTHIVQRLEEKIKECCFPVGDSNLYVVDQEASYIGLPFVHSFEEDIHTSIVFFIRKKS